MSESYAQAASRLLRRMDEYNNLVKLPVLAQGRAWFKGEMQRGRYIAGRDFDDEVKFFKRQGEARHECA